MAWHDSTPWANRKNQRGAVAVDRLAKVKKVLDAYEAGDLPAVKALGQIQDAASGDSDSIVRVGNVHKPEIET
jgi:hypothetical protein